MNEYFAIVYLKLWIVYVLLTTTSEIYSHNHLQEWLHKQ